MSTTRFDQTEHPGHRFVIGGLIYLAGEVADDSTSNTVGQSGGLLAKATSIWLIRLFASRSILDHGALTACPIGGAAVLRRQEVLCL
jgi:hypothetical protein